MEVDVQDAREEDVVDVDVEDVEEEGGTGGTSFTTSLSQLYGSRLLVQLEKKIYLTTQFSEAKQIDDFLENFKRLNST